jgi:Smg protein
MKESVLDVLMYLFENYMNDEIEFDTDEETLRVELQEAGFRQVEITRAFEWLEGLVAMQDDPSIYSSKTTGSIRIYTGEECEKLDIETRGFLLFLEQTGVLDHYTREMVIDRVMALGEDEIDLEQLKWVVLMVLFNQPGREAAFAWMEDLVFDEMPGILH